MDGGDRQSEAIRGFAHELGIVWESLSETDAHAHAVVTEALRQPAGIVHGGVYASIGETLASAATFAAVRGEGNVALGMSNQTTFLRPISEGTIHAAGRVRHRGRTTWIWDCDFSDGAGRLCALCRVTVAVRPARPAA